VLAGRTAPPLAWPRPPLEPLRDSEIRVLRYLPTNLTGPEIASELYVSDNTIRTHLRRASWLTAPAGAARGGGRQAGGRYHGPFGSRTLLFPNGPWRYLPVPVTASPSGWLIGRGESHR